MSLSPRVLALFLPLLLASNASGQDGPITLDVDATEAPRGLFHAKLVIPAPPGPLTLYYPKWIPGNHGPTGPIADLTGLKLQAAGKPVPWRRDDVDMYALHCTVPEGATALEVRLDYLSGISGRGQDATTQMAVVRWNKMVLYPKGTPIRRLQYQASLRLPAGWSHGSALTPAPPGGDPVRFAPVSLETLVDSPVLAGKHFRTVPLGTVDGRPHVLDLACDSPEGLDLPAETINHYRRLVAEAGKLFGARHYRDYHFLVTLTDHLGVHGLEHHESSDNGLPEFGLSDPKVGKPYADLLPHEYTHSWCGKYRRPAGLDTPTFQEPQETRLLWVYEGLTQYLGTVLAARAGLWTPAETRDILALTAEQMQNNRGRSWRPLEDTTLVAPMLAYGNGGWGAWRRGVDYYYEGVLIWLEVDTRLRELTQGKKSLDDFCRAFFGDGTGAPEVKPYTFDDVVKALNDVAPFDWKTLLNQHLTSTAEQAPLEGIVRSGWRLGYAEKPTDLETAAAAARKMVDASSSLGLWLSPDGTVQDVVPGRAADRAGIAPGMKVLSVNSRRFSPEGLARAVKASKANQQPIELIAENRDYVRVYKVAYHDGARHPRLERTAGRPDVLAGILKPRVEAASPAK